MALALPLYRIAVLSVHKYCLWLCAPARARLVYVRQAPCNTVYMGIPPGIGHPVVSSGVHTVGEPMGPRHGVGMFQLTIDGMKSVNPSAWPMLSHSLASAVVHAKLSNWSQRVHVYAGVRPMARSA